MPGQQLYDVIKAATIEELIAKVNEKLNDDPERAGREWGIVGGVVCVQESGATVYLQTIKRRG